jgi:hypothetical protein
MLSLPQPIMETEIRIPRYLVELMRARIPKIQKTEPNRNTNALDFRIRIITQNIEPINAKVKYKEVRIPN